MGSYASRVPVGNNRFELKCYIEDTNGRWVDFSDKSRRYGLDVLKSVGAITNTVETELGNAVSTIQNVIFDNSSGVFNRPFSSSLKAVDGSTASFDTSYGKKKPVLKGRKLKLSVLIRVPNDVWDTVVDRGSLDTVQEEPLGVFIIDRVTPSVGKKEATARVTSLDGKLQEKDCAKVRNGYSWYTNRSVSFLMEKILESEFGTLPAAYNIDKSPYMATLDGSLFVSNLGRPPLWDGTNWIDASDYARVLCVANVNSTGLRLYLGIGTELWSYNWSTGAYTLIGSVAAGYYIKFLAYDSVSQRLVIGAWEDEYLFADWHTLRPEGWLGRVYTWTGSGSFTLSISMPIFSFSYIALWGHQTDDFGAPYSGWRGCTFGSYVGGVSGGGRENFVIPFPQDVQMNGDLPATRYAEIWIKPLSVITGLNIPSGTGCDLGTTISNTYRQNMWNANGQFFGTLNGAATCAVFFRTSSTTATDNSMNQCVIYHVGQPYQMWLGSPVSSYSNERLCLSWCSDALHDVIDYNIFACSGSSGWGGPPPQVRLRWVRPSTGVGGVFDMLTELTDCIPLCVTEDTRRGLSITYWLKQYDNMFGQSTMSILHHTLQSNTYPPAHWSIPTVVTNGGTQQYWEYLPIAIQYLRYGASSTTDRLVIVFFNRVRAIYQVALTTIALSSEVQNASGNLYTKATKYFTATSPIVGLTYDEVDQCVYFYVTGEGRMYKITAAGVVTSLNSFPANGNEFGLLAGLAVDQTHTAGVPNIFGVTSPTDKLECFAAYQTGKYQLFRVSPYVSDIIEYADFTDLSKMEALKLLAQSRDGVTFFDRDGNFHYIPRVYTSATATYTFGRSPFTQLKGLEFDDGANWVYNYIRVETYDTSMETPGTEALTLLTRSVSSGMANLNNVTFVGYLLEQRNTLTQKVFAYCVTGGKTDDGKSLWKYTVVGFEIEAMVGSDVSSSATTAQLLSVFGGDNVEDGVHTGDFISAENPTTGATVTRGITVVNESTDQITLSSAFGFLVKARTPVRISRRNRPQATWVPTRWSDEGITFVDITASAGASSVALNKNRDVSVGTVLRFGSSTILYRVTAVDSGGRYVNFTPVLAEAAAYGQTVYAFYSPSAADGMEIGGTGVFVKWLGGSGVENTDYNKTFIAGDRLEIDCPGLKLDKQKAGTQLFVNTASISANDKKELPIDNRFMPRAIAEEIGRRLLYYYSNMKYQVKVTVPNVPYIDLVTDGAWTRIDLVNEEMFPTSRGFKEQFVIRSMSFDPKSGMTTFDLAGIEKY